MTAPTRSRRLLAATGLALLLAGGATACGASGTSDADPTTTTTAKTSTTSEPSTTTTTEDPGDGPSTTIEGPDGGRTTTTAVDEPAGDAGRQDYVDALKGSFDPGSGSDEFYSAKQVECLAESYVDIIGVEALVDADISPSELADGGGNGESPLPKELSIDEGQANELFDQFDGCDIDLLSLYKKVFSNLGQDQTAEQTACIDKVVTEENLRASFVADFTGAPLDPDPLDATSECLGF